MYIVIYKFFCEKMPIAFQWAFSLPYKLTVKTLYYISLIVIFAIVPAINAGERTDFLVNDDNTTALQNSPRIAVAVDQSFVITWIDRREATSDIYIQKFDSSGFPIGDNLKINDDTNDSYQFEPAIAVELSGQYALVWKDYRTGTYPTDPEIFMQSFDSQVVVQGINSQISLGNANVIKDTPDISLTDTKQSIIVWGDYRNNNWDIYGQIIDSDGSPNGSNFLVNDDIVNAQQHRPRVSVSNEGWFVVTWYENRLGNDDIYVQVFDSTGTAIGSNFRVNQDQGTARQAFPDVTTDGAGNFTVVWVDWRNGTYPGNPDIYSRKFTSSMVPLTDEININTDGAATAQREPAISADRLGNVAIIWADSIRNSWDISGQMIDVDGVVRETNFKANSDTDSAQVSPDVAIDGKNRYVTWVDRRNGNYDIYASIQQYNDPNLAVSVNTIQFNMQQGGSLPSSETMIVDHLGYNPLDFTISSNVDWLNITPQTSTTTDTVLVSVNTDTLPIGIYTGILTFIDHTYNDSSLSVGVRLNVYSPIMELSQDTVKFLLFEGINDSSYQSISIDNASLGSFSWTASENILHANLSTYAGFSEDTVEIVIDPQGLIAGTYYDNVIFSSSDALGSPDTLVVYVEVINNMPYLQATPDSIFIYTDSISNFIFPIVVTNLGTDSLNWTATTNAGWFTLDTTNGTDNDSVDVLISSVAFGKYTGYVQFTDSTSFNKSIQVPIILDYYQTSEDTLQFSNTNTATLQPVSVSLTLQAFNKITEIHIPFQFDTTLLQIDSIIKGVTTPDITTLGYAINNTNGTAIIDIEMISGDTSLQIGNSHLAEIFFTAKAILGISTIDSIITDSISTYVIDNSNQRFSPQVLAGFINVDVSTSIEDDIPVSVPQTIELSQNYPNPFNLSTIIVYSLPVRSEVSISIFNILGQKIRRLVSQTQPAGNHQVEWNGQYDDGRIAPSGIYFYRLEANSKNFVKKMVLLK